ncbi:protein of unknown function DUF59 [hydrothermal vent metagenome]|uniref:Iron-sulfur cluster carrier protein n=1 Tax=hydrothermal vent metagenome TaxID=652676 RepID=A0A1W1BQ03_9ZZZZ
MRENSISDTKNIIAITSGKGGVGKSTISVNLSIALAQLGYSVALLDADIYGPDTPRMLNISDNILKWNSQDKIIPSENFGIKLMSVGLTTPNSDTPLVWRSSVAVSAIKQFLDDVEWGELDFLIIDMPPGTGDIQLTISQELPLSRAIIITTPQPVSTDDASRAIAMYQDIGIDIIGVIENMSYFIAPDTGIRYNIFGENGGKILSDRYNIPLLGQIPIDIDIRKASDSGLPTISLGKDSTKLYYQNIIKELLHRVEELDSI